MVSLNRERKIAFVIRLTRRESIMSFISIKNVWKSYGDNLVLERLNLEVEQGEFVSMVGASGCGKSTFLNMLLGREQPSKGTIVLDGQALKEEPDADRGIVFQKYSVFPHLTVLQNVMIARALAQDTDLIILDEPTTHLDMYHKAYTLKLLQRLTKETGKTILFSSHEIDLAIQLCDNLIVMTDEDVVSDEPCNLISKGVFQSLFPKDLIAFDEKTGSFKVKK